MVRIVHVISSLGVGGAEIMLAKLAAHQRAAGNQVEVVTLLSHQPLAERLRNSGVVVSSLGVRPEAPDPLALLRLVRMWRRSKPNIVHAWMYHAILIGAVAARLAGGVPVVWALRQSNLDRGLNKRRTLWFARACGWLSRRVSDTIVCNSHAGLEAHVPLGFPKHRMTVLPNAFQPEAFRPDPEARTAVRRELGIPGDAPVVGIVARWEPQKDHRSFLAAMRIVKERIPRTHVVMVGRDIDRGQPQLAAWMREDRLGDEFHLLGHRDDVARIMASFDVSCSSSVGEGFPTAVGEAMSCGVPCVATDVGDSALLVGDTGRIVPSRQPQLLAQACIELLGLPARKRAELGSLARERIQQKFSAASVFSNYDELYRRVLTDAAGGAA